MRDAFQPGKGSAGSAVSYTHLDVYKRQKQYYIVKDYGFCLIQLTNFSGSETTEQAARDMVDSFVWDTEG